MHLLDVLDNRRWAEGHEASLIDITATEEQPARKILHDLANLASCGVVDTSGNRQRHGGISLFAERLRIDLIITGRHKGADFRGGGRETPTTCSSSLRLM